MKFTKIVFNSHKVHNPYCDILCGYIDNNTYITYYSYVATPQIEGMEYYSGENYGGLEGTRSFSRQYKVNEIPAKYKALWGELKQKYWSEYKGK